ncbi:FecR domain-containing protein [Pontibacter korlensis]|uniref:FecR family protein n=1 Tax=Pontibacter korlensis TaxID=400092 RepID=UPI000697B43D|nr:FecR domain-containing protein [Pontibacter korlensis]
MDKQELKQLLQKAAQNRLNPAEQEQLDQWYNSFDARGKNRTVFRDEAHEEQVRLRLWSKIQTRFPQEQTGAFGGTIIDLWQNFNSTYRNIAAGLLLLITAASFFIYLTNNTPTYISLRAPAGKIKQITLSDGSQVWLNAKSELRYPEEFEGDLREVYLEGEAFFEVARDTTKPFIIHADHLKTQVLGTSFNIRSYRGATQATVSVSSGKVAVTEGKDQVMLKANQEARYNSQTAKLSKNSFNAEGINWWQKQGEFQFREESLADIAIVLGNKFGKKITVQNPTLASKHITASFDNKDSFQDITDILKMITGLQSHDKSETEVVWH